MEATTRWTEGKPWEIAWGGSIEKERVRDGNDKKMDGGETVGNSLGRAVWGRSEMEATTLWTGGKPWEIARGELRWEGGRWKRRYRVDGGKLGESSVGKERDRSKYIGWK